MISFSDHMSSSKTALRSSETCLILDFSTTRSSSTFDVTFEEVCDENGGKSDFFFSRPENGGKSDYERETTKVIEDITRAYLQLDFSITWPSSIFCGSLWWWEWWWEWRRYVHLNQTNKNPNQTKKKTKYLPHSRIPSPPPPYQSWRWAGRCPSRHSRSECPPFPTSRSAPDREHGENLDDNDGGDNSLKVEHAKLRYKRSTPTSKEPSSPIFQSLSVSL